MNLALTFLIHKFGCVVQLIYFMGTVASRRLVDRYRIVETEAPN